jgi:hypothetical protein
LFEKNLIFSGEKTKTPTALGNQMKRNIRHAWAGDAGSISCAGASK